MTDAPVAQHTPSPHPGVKGFMTNNLAGMPTWVWIVVIVAGIGAAVIIPKLLAGKSSNSSGNATTTGTTPDSGLGLAIDPTTGLPYAVEGLVPSGGTVGDSLPPLPPVAQPPTPTPTPTLPPSQCPTGFTFQAYKAGVTVVKGAMPTTGGWCVPNAKTPPTKGTGDGDGDGDDTKGGHQKMPPVIHGTIAGAQPQPVAAAWPGGATHMRAG